MAAKAKSRTARRRKPAVATFRDRHYNARTVTVAGAELRVEDGRLTVSDPARIEALEADPGFERIG